MKLRVDLIALTFVVIFYLSSNFTPHVSILLLPLLAHIFMGC